MAALPGLEAGENLGRSVASETAAKRARRTGVVIPNIFLEGRGRGSISVDRMDHAPLRAMAELAMARAAARVPPKRLEGWAMLSVQQAASDGRTVEATPHPDNAYHADILLNIADSMSDIERRRQQKLHAKQLALHATWREAP